MRFAAFAYALLAAVALCAPAGSLARGYTPQGRCGPYERVLIDVLPAGHCLALVADEREGLRYPRRILEVAPGRWWVIDMGSWVPKQGRLLELTLPPGAARARVQVLAERLDRPLGLALGPDGKAWVGEAGQIWRTTVPAAGQTVQREVMIPDLPSDGAHPLKELSFGPGGMLYVNMGSVTDACRDDAQRQPLPCPELTGPPPRAAVYRAELDAANGWRLKRFAPFATGLRNSVALLALPSGRVLQGENGIDYPDEKAPPEELNLLEAGQHYGWPYCVGAGQAARGYERRYDCKRSRAPLQIWPAHVAPLQLLTGAAGTPYAGQLIAVWHGQRAAGHRLMSVPLGTDDRPKGAPKPLLAGWDAKPGVRPQGRPTGATVDRQGRLWVVEDFNRTVLLLRPMAP